MELADGAALEGGCGMVPDGGKDDVHQRLHEGSDIGRLGGRGVSGSRVQCFGCSIQINVPFTDVLNQVSQERQTQQQTEWERVFAIGQRASGVVRGRPGRWGVQQGCGFCSTP